MEWPNDADGGVFRSLQDDGFDFEKECSIDFNIDFDHWPLDEKPSRKSEVYIHSADLLTLMKRI